MGVSRLTSVQYPYSPNSSLYFSSGTDKENLFHNQSFLDWLVIISYVLMILMNDSAVLL